MNCTACGKELAKKEALYTEERLPYCPNPFECNDRHPNSVKNILQRGDAVKMFTEEELEINLFENLPVTDEMKKRITRIISKPQSIRIPRVELAHYILEMQELQGFPSIAEAVRYCIERTMEAEPIDPLALPTPKPEPEAVVQPVVIEKKPGVKVVPRAQDLIMKQIEEKKKEEDELVF